MLFISSKKDEKYNINKERKKFNNFIINNNIQYIYNTCVIIYSNVIYQW